MEDNKQKKDWVEVYATQRRYAPPVRPETVERAPEDYLALVEDRQGGRTPRFRIVDRMGVSYGSGYAWLLGWMFTPPDLLSLETTTHQFLLEGRGMERIEKALLEEKMRELHEYNPERHNPPGDEDIIIERIQIKSRLEQTP